jgi:hypothetical protein
VTETSSYKVPDEGVLPEVYHMRRQMTKYLVGFEDLEPVLADII